MSIVENNFQITFCDLRSKEVVNSVDGKRMGRIVDLVFLGETGKIKGIVTPYGKRGPFGKGQDIFIPWRCVDTVGEDVIIVNLNDNGSCGEEVDKKDKCKDKEERPSLPCCDGRCEKCMLFDCERRWKK